MRNVLSALLCLALWAFLPALAHAHGSNVFETGKPAAAHVGHEHKTSPAAHAGESSAEEEFEELHDAIHHLEEQLAEHDRRVRVTDILGGIGFIAGIAGAAYYYLGLRRRAKQ